MKDRVSITIEPVVNKRAHEFASEQKRSFSNLVEMALDYYLEAVRSERYVTELPKGRT